MAAGDSEGKAIDCARRRGRAYRWAAFVGGAYPGALSLTLGLAAVLAATPAFAGSFDNLCIQAKIGGSPSCTANDLRVGTMQRSQAHRAVTRRIRLPSR
jgi:hypothetical protein